MKLRYKLLSAGVCWFILCTNAHAELWVKQTGVDNSNPVNSSNPYPVTVSGSGGGTSSINIKQVAGVATGSTNPLAVQLSQGNTAIGATNGIFTNPLQGNAVLSATNGLFTNILQGNAVLSKSNPIFTAGGSTTIANMSNVALTPVTATSTTVTLAAAARNLSVFNGDSIAIVSVDPTSGTASTTNGLKLNPGIGYSWLGLAAPITTFTYYSTAPAGTLNFTYTAY
jgi:hypothetical protein